MSAQRQTRSSQEYGIIKVDVNSDGDPLVEEVIASEKIITQDQFEVELEDGASALVHVATGISPSNTKPTLIRPKGTRRARSNIWMYFDKGYNTGRCRKCGATIKTAGNTMNMWNHLQRRHPREHSMIRKLAKHGAVGSSGDDNDGFDSSALVEEVVTSEKVITQEQLEAELQNGDGGNFVEFAECDPSPSPKRRVSSQPKPKRTAKSRPSARSSFPSYSSSSQRMRSESPPVDAKNVTQILTNVQHSLQSMEKMDSFQVFGNYVAEELRKIPSAVLANKMQRKMTRHLMDCMDEADAAYANQSGLKNDY